MAEDWDGAEWMRDDRGHQSGDAEALMYSGKNLRSSNFIIIFKNVSLILLLQTINVSFKMWSMTYSVCFTVKFKCMFFVVSPVISFVCDTNTPQQRDGIHATKLMELIIIPWC